MDRDPSLSKLPPQAVDVEEAILSAILIDNDSLIEASDTIGAHDFYREGHQIIFRAMQAISGPIDLLTLVTHLRDNNDLEAIGGAAALARLVDAVPMATNVENYCKIIQDKAIKRKIIKQSLNLVASCYEDKEKGQALLDRYQKDSTSIDVQGQDEMVHISTIVTERLEHYEKIANKPNIVTGVSSGFYNLDRMTSGFQPSDLIILAARPGMGKSAIALNMALNAGKKGHKVAFFSLEMSKEQLIDRFFATEARINLEKTRSGQFRGDNIQQLVNAGGRLYELPFYIYDKASMHYSEIHSIARKHKIKNGLDMIIVDHIQIANGDKSNQQHVVIGSISRGLKKTAKDLGIPVLALSQLNRDCVKRDNKRPQVIDLRDSGSLEQDTDIVLFLHRESEYHKDVKPEKIDPAELSISKQRNGVCGTVYLGFNGAIQEFLQTDRHSM